MTCALTSTRTDSSTFFNISPEFGLDLGHDCEAIQVQVIV